MAVEFALLSSSLRLMVLQIILLGFLCLNKFSSTHSHLRKLYNSNPSSTKLIIIYQIHTKFLCTEKFKLSFCCFVMSSWFCFIFYLDQGLTNFFYKGPDIEYFRPVDHTISATKTKICQYSKNIQQKYTKAPPDPWESVACSHLSLLGRTTHAHIPQPFTDHFSPHSLWNGTPHQPSSRPPPLTWSGLGEILPLSTITSLVRAAPRYQCLLHYYPLFPLRPPTP